MAIKTLPKTAKDFDEHRLEMIELARRVNEQAGIVGEPYMTPEEIQEHMRQTGIRAEDNIGSRDIICTRYGDEE